jgi:RNA polymerase primary sigma factor
MEYNNINDIKHAVFYKKQIDKIDFLSKEAEKRLVLKIKEGDNNARKRLAESYLPLAFSKARKCHKSLYRSNYNITIMELVQEANKIMLESIDKFEISHNSRFGTYASKKIEL